VANKSQWIALDAEIARHRLVQFSWVEAHGGIVLNEIADTLATWGVKGSSYCPTERFDELPADTEPDEDSGVG
jgi:ribonuclease HI